MVISPTTWEFHSSRTWTSIGATVALLILYLPPGQRVITYILAASSELGLDAALPAHGGQRDSNPAWHLHLQRGHEEFMHKSGRLGFSPEGRMLSIMSITTMINKQEIVDAHVWIGMCPLSVLCRRRERQVVSDLASSGNDSSSFAPCDNYYDEGDREDALLSSFDVDTRLSRERFRRLVTFICYCLSVAKIIDPVQYEDRYGSAEITNCAVGEWTYMGMCPSLCVHCAAFMSSIVCI